MVKAGNQFIHRWCQFSISGLGLVMKYWLHISLCNQFLIQNGKFRQEKVLPVVKLIEFFYHDSLLTEIPQPLRLFIILGLCRSWSKGYSESTAQRGNVATNSKQQIFRNTVRHSLYPLCVVWVCECVWCVWCVCEWGGPSSTMIWFDTVCKAI